jgi:serine/threonine protein kinase
MALHLSVAGGLGVEIPRTIGSYEFVRVIGEGTYSVICLLQSTATREYHACKVVPRAVLEHADLLMYFERELRILQTIRHPNVVRLTDVLYTQSVIYVVMEYCACGDLLVAIQERGCLDDAQCRRAFRDILLGLAYLHARGIAHRDVKPENILLDGEGTAKLSDFGLSQEIAPDRLLSTRCGSFAYCAPEVLRGEEYDGRRVDVWSLGILLYAMCSGRLPWTSHKDIEICAQIVAGKFAMPMLASDGAKRVIARMLAQEPDRRPTVPELLQDPWVGALAHPRGLFESQSVGIIQVRQAKTNRSVQIDPLKHKVVVRPHVEGSRRLLGGSRIGMLRARGSVTF